VGLLSLLSDSITFLESSYNLFDGILISELKALEIEAAENDGRLARRSLKDRKSEIQAHSMLLSQFTRMIQDHDAALEVKAIYT